MQAVDRITNPDWNFHSAYGRVYNKQGLNIFISFSCFFKLHVTTIFTYQAKDIYSIRSSDFFVVVTLSFHCNG